MLATTTRLGPADHGRTMSLAEFDHAEADAGFRYELSRGVVTVVEVPNPSHLAMQHAVLRQLYAYDATRPGVIQLIGPSGSSKMLIEHFESERHPDVAVYKTAPPTDNSTAWAVWVPELAVEIVSSDSRHRDYDEKPDEYLQFGVQEYWILDAERAEMLVHRRVGGRWKKQIVKPPELHTTHLLPDLQFSCEAVFAAAK
ncbi:MAG: Uma2 family endonuclease [Planctomycetota bacterium]